jgi:hypothetical protein
MPYATSASKSHMRRCIQSACGRNLGTCHTPAPARSGSRSSEERPEGGDQALNGLFCIHPIITLRVPPHSFYWLSCFFRECLIQSLFHLISRQLVSQYLRPYRPPPALGYLSPADFERCHSGARFAHAHPSLPSCSRLSRGLKTSEHEETSERRPALTGAARDGQCDVRAGTKERAPKGPNKDRMHSDHVA